MNVPCCSHSLRRRWKGLSLLLFLVLALLFMLVLVRFNITGARSEPLSQLQRALGLNQPSHRTEAQAVDIIGHRGSLGGESPKRIENTQAAIDHAIATGVDWIEVDVRRCGNELILFHDEDISRWLEDIGNDTYGKQPGQETDLVSLSLEKLREIEGTTHGKNNRVLSLKDLFREYPPSENGQKWVLDIKGEEGSDAEKKEVHKRLLPLLTEVGLAGHKDRVVLQGTFDIIATYKESGYSLAYAAGWSEGLNKFRFLLGHSFIVNRCSELGAHLQYLSLPDVFVNASLIEDAKERLPRLRVWTYGGEEEESWKKSISFGIDGLIVDRVIEAAQLRDRRIAGTIESRPTRP